MTLLWLEKFSLCCYKEVLLDQISLQLSLGECVGLIGESGSGKSKLAEAILQLLPEGFSCEGGYLFQGVSVLALSTEEKRLLRKNHIGLVTQHPENSFDPTLSIKAHIEEVINDRCVISRFERKQYIGRLLEALQLDHQVLEKYPHELSGGMLQRLSIGLNLITPPSLLILDEPTTALDALTQMDILRLLLSIKKRYRMSLLFISHDLRVVRALCQRLYVLQHGKIVEHGNTEDIVFSSHPYTQLLVGDVLENP